MRFSSPRLRRLDEVLASFPPDSEVMLLGELDGFIAGVITSPELVPTAEWLSLVWGEDDTLFEDADEQSWFVLLVMRHYQAVVRGLARGSGQYRPPFEIDPRNGEILWEIWMEGFAYAMDLRPESWDAIMESGDEQAATALAGMITLAEIAEDRSDLERAEIDRLTAAAPELIARWLSDLHDWRLEHRGAPPTLDATPAAKVGRNDPCPCGSGRKHKKCCGAN